MPIVTGHDSNGKAIVATDEQLPGAVSPSRPGISRCEIWSADKIPVDNSEGKIVPVPITLSSLAPFVSTIGEEPKIESHTLLRKGLR